MAAKQYAFNGLIGNAGRALWKTANGENPAGVVLEIGADVAQLTKRCAGGLSCGLGAAWTFLDHATPVGDVADVAKWAGSGIKKIFVTYTKLLPDGSVYSGRASGSSIMTP